jgi:transcriptional regulator with XRE-family HTH domain
VPRSDRQLLGAWLREQRERRGLSRGQLSREIADVTGLYMPEITIKDFESDKPRARTIERLEALAATFDVPPQTFVEYRLAVARRELDEREVGFDQAVKTLKRIEPLLPPR